MIQLNLLPDVKLEYIKAERQQRLVMSASIIVTVASIGLLLLLLSVSALQKKHLNDLSRDITSESSKLQNEPQINKILTVQNQLGSLTALHDKEPAASRVLEYLNETTPANASITDFTIDLTQSKETITGTSASLAAVNQYVDNLKNTSYTTDANSTPAPAFSNVVLTNFSLNTGSQNPGQAANYTIDLSYDPTIFDITKKVKLSVPNILTSQLQLGGNGSLFQAAPSKGAQQ